jgi:hypothetical protein
MDFLAKQSALEKRTVHLITGARKFFDQGTRPTGWTGEYSREDCAARELWHYVKKDLQPETHPNSYFRALILLYLFHPSECSRPFYLKQMPRWIERWRGVKQTPEIDFLWVIMLCRARKYVKKNDFDWGIVMRHLEHVGPMLEDNRWNDRPRRMSTNSSVMDYSSLYDDLSNVHPSDECLEDVDEDDDPHYDTEELRTTFMKEYNDGPRATELEYTLPVSIRVARKKHFAEQRRLSQESQSCNFPKID